MYYVHVGRDIVAVRAFAVRVRVRTVVGAKRTTRGSRSIFCRKRRLIFKGPTWRFTASMAELFQGSRRAGYRRIPGDRPGCSRIRLR